MQPNRSRRNAILGAITIAGLAISFVLALRARDRVDVPLVIVAPAGTRIEIDGREPRVLPQQPNSPSDLTSFYFLTQAGDHDVRFQAPGRSARTQTVTVPASRLPVIYSLLRDTLRVPDQRP